MESIFHEKQEGYLCAQHCLNALLQGPYFNAVDLANLAQQMDEEERLRMAESGVDSDDYRRFMQQPSENMDDSGYFSVQVISSALKVWGLELIPYNSTEPTALIAQDNPSQMRAYICNYKGHWFTIRKLGNQWFNLNSVLSGPQLLSDTYLSMFIAQLLQEGYSIFIVIGDLPQCTADDVLLKNPVTTASKSRPSVTKPESVGYRLGTAAEDEREKIQQAVAAFGRVQVPASSLNSFTASSSGEKSKERIIPITVEDDDDGYDDAANLKKALQLSLQDTDDDTEKSLKLRLKLDSNSKQTPPEEEEDDELRKALQLSLECVTAPTTPDPDDLRWRRLAYLGSLSRSGNESQLNT
ncbi:ataxin-3-like [Microplitis mediator]|uniref:ataxin-3-like n=1 Tax=Microplitis mediator TaxID=375433 RepID=UPI002555FEBD|nr:ataxin-3-like [Microplitis mediator]